MRVVGGRVWQRYAVRRRKLSQRLGTGHVCLWKQPLDQRLEERQTGAQAFDTPIQSLLARLRRQALDVVHDAVATGVLARFLPALLLARLALVAARFGALPLIQRYSARAARMAATRGCGCGGGHGRGRVGAAEFQGAGRRSMARTSRERCEHIETLFVPVDDGTAIAPQLLCDGECRALCAIVVMSVPSVIEAAVSSPVGPSSTNSHESMTISNAQHHLPLAACPLLYHHPSVSSSPCLKPSVAQRPSSGDNFEPILACAAGRRSCPGRPLSGDVTPDAADR